MSSLTEEVTATTEQSPVTTGSSQDSVKVIKRYPNRKLYDTTQARYLNLTQIFSLLEEGQKFKVISNKTKEEITTAVLLSALVEKSKGAKSTDIIRMLEFVASYIKGGANGQEQ